MFTGVNNFCENFVGSQFVFYFIFPFVKNDVNFFQFSFEVCNFSVYLLQGVNNFYENFVISNV